MVEASVGRNGQVDRERRHGPRRRLREQTAQAADPQRAQGYRRRNSLSTRTS
jgi:hypothetical protein